MNILEITQQELDAMHHLYRINLVNGITGYKSANLIGTKSASGIPNVAVFSSVTHFGSNPPLIGFVLRPTTVPRNTYENIKETGIYTINHINSNIIQQAHHTAAKYPDEISEFEKANLTASYLDDFEAPFVGEAVIKLAMQFEEEIPIKANGTILVLGSIQKIILPEELVAPDGFVDLNLAETVAISGLDAYHAPKWLSRFDYARPDVGVKVI